jgi:hypothetical protein
MEKATDGPILDKPNQDLKWFLDTMADEQSTRRIFSKEFIDKHGELKGDTRAWVAWARKEFEKIAAEEQALLQKELTRLPSAPESSKPKWAIKVRLHTPSHSIRPKVLNYWNKRMNWAKLSPAGSKNELLLELTLHDSVPLTELYDAGLSFSKLCIAALNIGSLGFFWYDLPRQTSRYYESIRDLDTPKMDVGIDKAAGFLGDWKRGALTEKNLQHAIECIAVFGPMPNNEVAPIFGPYLHGLVLLSKWDIHLSCEEQARDAFIETLRKGCKHFGDWDGSSETFIPSLHRVFESIIPKEGHRDVLFEIILPPHKTADGSHADAMSAKRLTDLYLCLVADRRWSERTKRSLEHST